jgi:hypothetical protein
MEYDLENTSLGMLIVILWFVDALAIVNHHNKSYCSQVKGNFEPKKPAHEVVKTEPIVIKGQNYIHQESINQS